MAQQPLAIASADDPDYYLHNFLLVLEVVAHRDAHLFSDEEARVFQALSQLSDGARRLYIRLSNRKGPLFRVDTLSYAEIHSCAQAAEALAAAGFAAYGSEDDPVADVLKLFTVKELQAVGRTLALELLPRCRRDDIVMALTEKATEDRGGVEQALAGFGPRIRLLHGPLFDRVNRLFFLNAYQGPGTLLAVDLAHVTYPNYAVHRARAVFTSRESLLNYEAAREEGALLAQALEQGDSLAASALLAAAAKGLGDEDPQLDHPFLARFSSPWVRARTLSWVARALERAKDYDGAIALYKRLLSTPLRPRRRGGWWERLVTDLSHLGRHHEALDAAERALEDPWLEDFRRPSMSRRLRRLAKKCSRPHPPMAAPPSIPIMRYQGKILSSGPRQRTHFEGADGEPILVERLVLERAAAEGWSGTYAENALYTHLFALTLWDIIFMDIPDVFQTPFQDAPLDLMTEVFYPSRKAAIDARLEALRNGEAPALLRAAHANHGRAARGAHWGIWPVEQLEAFALALGGHALAIIVHHLALDYRRNARGLPDLLLIKEGQARMVEVKGPRDRLSPEQAAWLERLMLAKVDVAVCHVTEASRK